MALSQTPEFREYKVASQVAALIFLEPFRMVGLEPTKAQILEAEAKFDQDHDDGRLGRIFYLTVVGLLEKARELRKPSAIAA